MDTENEPDGYEFVLEEHSPDLALVESLTDSLHRMKELAKRQAKRIHDLETLAFCAYQAMGAIDAPVKWLDALSDAANGDHFSVDGLLPFPGDGEEAANLRAFVMEQWPELSGGPGTPTDGSAIGEPGSAPSA